MGEKWGQQGKTAFQNIFGEHSARAQEMDQPPPRRGMATSEGCSGEAWRSLGPSHALSHPHTRGEGCG